MSDRIDELRKRFASTEGRKAPAGLLRLWTTGRSAAGMARGVLGARFRGNGQGLEGADLDAVTRLVERLGELKGVAMKAGQILGWGDPEIVIPPVVPEWSGPGVLTTG